MKPASLVLFVLAVGVAMAWPLASAIGAARTSAPQPEVRTAACLPEDTTTAAPEDDEDDDEGEALALPPGHPSLGSELPPGHPPLPADGLPPGHPPVGRGLPPGHPPVPSGHGFGVPSPLDLFGTPVLLTI